jgi:hypothetical protein
VLSVAYIASYWPAAFLAEKKNMAVGMADSGDRRRRFRFSNAAPARHNLRYGFDMKQTYHFSKTQLTLLRALITERCGVSTDGLTRGRVATYVRQFREGLGSAASAIEKMSAADFEALCAALAEVPPVDGKLGAECHRR